MHRARHTWRQVYTVCVRTCVCVDVPLPCLDLQDWDKERSDECREKKREAEKCVRMFEDD